LSLKHSEQKLSDVTVITSHHSITRKWPVTHLPDISLLEFKKYPIFGAPLQWTVFHWRLFILHFKKWFVKKCKTTL